LAEISLKTLREHRLISKAELARMAGVSSLTIDRIERGLSCRPDTLRKRILALGYTPDDKEGIFPDIAVSTPK
jgi:DNA-binding XRE family transcriptional regulator